MLSANGDSVAVLRLATGAIDDGSAQSEPRSAVLFVLMNWCHARAVKLTSWVSAAGFLLRRDRKPGRFSEGLLIRRLQTRQRRAAQTMIGRFAPLGSRPTTANGNCLIFGADLLTTRLSNRKSSSSPSGGMRIRF